MQGEAADHLQTGVRPVNPRKFNRSMRKPSMRFARTGTSVQESAAAFISGGSGTGEGEGGEDEDSGVLPKSRASGRRRDNANASGASSMRYPCVVVWPTARGFCGHVLKLSL